MHKDTSPVKRERAELYIFLSLVSFAASVSITRIYLELANYPQIGNGTLHIAHLLWGGLALFIASLYPLILYNKWAFKISAILSGVGMGLFIDEVGKFITRTNDYFYPPAAPIIYSFFLMTVFIYLQVRRSENATPRAELYRALDSMQEVLDNDLSDREHTVIKAKLEKAVHSNNSDVRLLAQSLQKYVETRGLKIIKHVPSFFEHLYEQFHNVGPRFLTKNRLKALVIAGLLVAGAFAIIELTLLVLIGFGKNTALDRITDGIITNNEIGNTKNTLWFTMRLALEGVAGILALVGAIFLAMGKEVRGISTARISFLITLTIVNLLIFYLDQFQAIFDTLIKFGFLVVMNTYRRWYLVK